MDRTEIGKRLIEARAGRSRKEVCAALDMPASTLQMYENGKRMPSDDVKVKFSNFYNIPIEKLFFHL